MKDNDGRRRDGGVWRSGEVRRAAGGGLDVLLAEVSAVADKASCHRGRPQPQPTS